MKGAAGPGAGETLEGLVMRAKSTIDSVQQSQDQYSSAAREEIETYDRLQTIRALLTAAHGYAHYCHTIIGVSS